MGFLNYTTGVPVSQTRAEIETLLAAKGATSITAIYDGRVAVGLSFRIREGDRDLDFRVPLDVDAVWSLLREDWEETRHRTRKGRPDREQAARTAWRTMKDWIEAQIALIEMGMARLDEVMLPYMLDGRGQTLYQVLAGQRFALPAPSEEDR